VVYFAPDSSLRTILNRKPLGISFRAWYAAQGTEASPSPVRRTRNGWCALDAVDAVLTSLLALNSSSIEDDFSVLLPKFHVYLKEEHGYTGAQPTWSDVQSFVIKCYLGAGDPRGDGDVSQALRRVRLGNKCRLLARMMAAGWIPWDPSRFATHTNGRYTSANVLSSDPVRAWILEEGLEGVVSRSDASVFERLDQLKASSSPEQQESLHNDLANAYQKFEDEGILAPGNPSTAQLRRLLHGESWMDVMGRSTVAAAGAEVATGMPAEGSWRCDYCGKIFKRQYNPDGTAKPLSTSANAVAHWNTPECKKAQRLQAAQAERAQQKAQAAAALATAPFAASPVVGFRSASTAASPSKPAHAAASSPFSRMDATSGASNGVAQQHQPLPHTQLPSIIASSSSSASAARDALVVESFNLGSTRLRHLPGREWGSNDLVKNLELYFQCCSIQTTAEGQAIIGATLASGGRCALTDQQCFSGAHVRNCLSLMLSCGMYDYSGEWAYKIGLPAKSGVSGCLMVVIPNVGGLSIYSPPLDALGNTVRGIEFCKRLVQKCCFSSFASTLSNKVRLYTYDAARHSMQECAASTTSIHTH
jgi:hypothetical protein